MITSISSEARRNQTSILIRDRENHVSQKPDRQTYRQTNKQSYGRTDISNYGVASLLKTYPYLTWRKVCMHLSLIKCWLLDKYYKIKRFWVNMKIQDNNISINRRNRKIHVFTYISAITYVIILHSQYS